MDVQVLIGYFLKYRRGIKRRYQMQVIGRNKLKVLGERTRIIDAEEQKEDVRVISEDQLKQHCRNKSLVFLQDQIENWIRNQRKTDQDIFVNVFLITIRKYQEKINPASER
ncbi:unnamed protein product [Paramecium octaurelia]|uniref:Uncharacterized protein n=1 Tax=Paramecium octaurelia TaxID=43137 RepID=A0A8S1YL34_PAROT|nr:unnamed protein product [Paramecium octaurelia]